MPSLCQCRSCDGRRLRVFLDLGQQPLANSLLRKDEAFDSEPRYPLKVAVCENCWLVQITETIPPATLFEEYPYFSSFSDSMLRHASESVDQHIADGRLDRHSFVVEIASNDGYLLKNFVAAAIPCLGIEPAKNIAETSIKAGIPTICEFFGKRTASAIGARHGQADLIIGNNVFAHAPEINDFIAGLALLLKEGGRIALEFPYLGSFIDHVEFDTVYHEHVFYFSLTALQPAFARHELELFDVEQLTIHGGSLRLFVGHVGRHAITPRFTRLLAAEQSSGMSSIAYYEAFGARVRVLRERLLGLLRDLKAREKSIAAYGASAKGSTLLNYFGIGAEILDFVADRSTYKQGRVTPGTHLPIVAPEELLARMPDYTLLLTWNFASEILEQQQAYRRAGGKFIIPLPEPHIA